MQYKRFILLVVALVLVIGLALPVGAQGKSITVSWPQEPDSLNPMYTTMTFAGYTYSLYLAPAWDYDAEYNPHPVLVTEIPSRANGGISDDGTIFTLKLNEGMVWSDGDPLDAADFVFTYEMFMSDNNTPLTRSPYDSIASIEAPDPLTVVVNFDEPYAPWLGLFPAVLPEHVLRPVYEAEGTLDNADFNRNPTVASGPYMLETWDSGNFMRFLPNENFVGGVANIDVMVVTFIPDDTAYVNSVATGESDVATFIPFNEVPGLEEIGIQIVLIPSGYNEGWFLNTSEERAHPAMLDVRVREAIGLAFDRFSFNEDLNLGITYPASSYWENTPFDNPDVEAIPFDQDRARELLDEAGWVDSDGDGVRDKDGVKLELRFIATTRQIRQDMQAVAQQQLAEVGISIIIENYESNVYFNGYAEGGPAATGNYDIATWSSSPDSFPDPETDRFECDQIPSDDNPVGGNWNYYCDPELDDLFEAQRTMTDFDERVAAFHQIDQKLQDAYIWLPVWYDADVWATSARLENAKLNGTTPFWDVVNWDVSE